MARKIRSLPDAPSMRPPRDPSNELSALVRSAQAGDEEAMHRLLLAIMPRVRNGVRYLVRGDDIDDLVQDVLETVLLRIEAFRGEGRFESWVNGVTLRVVIGRRRKHLSDVRRLSEVTVDDVASLRQGERYATSRQLARALDQLPDDQREALVMHHVFGLTAPEVADEQRVGQETVRSRLRHGMGMLRMLLLPDREKHDGP